MKLSDQAHSGLRRTRRKAGPTPPRIIPEKKCEPDKAPMRRGSAEPRPDILPLLLDHDWIVRLGGQMTWREKLWVVPSETRIGTAEMAEALGRPKSWIYARTQANAESKIPHRRLDGFLLFVVGEIRDWIQEREEVFPAHSLREVE